MNLLKRADLKNKRDRMLKPIFEDLPSKKDCGRPLLLGDTICLAQYKQYVLDLFGNGLDELQFVSRDGRIGSDHSDSGIDMRQKRVRGGTIAFEYRTQAGRVHEAHALQEQWTGNKYLNPGNALSVLRVFFLSNILLDFMHRDFSPLSTLQAKACSVTLAESHYRGNCGNRNDSAR